MMTLFSNHRERFLTSLIIIFSLGGIIYFTLRAMREAKTNKENPYEYRLDGIGDDRDAYPRYSLTIQLSIPLNSPRAIVVSGEKQIIVGGDETVLRVDMNNRIDTVFSTGAPIRCLTVRDDKIYVGLRDHVEVYGTTGKKLAQWAWLNDESVLTSLAISRDHLYAADAGNRIVWQYAHDGKLTNRIGEKDTAKDIPGFIIPSPYFDVAVDADGFLWVANTGRHALENYTETGDFRTSWGEYGLEIQKFAGCCNPSHFTLLADGSFVTSEKGIPRIKVYNLYGELTAVVAGPEQFSENTVGLDLAADDSGTIYVLDPMRKAVLVFEEMNGTPEEE